MKHLHWVAMILFGGALCSIFWGEYPPVGLMFGVLFGVLIHETRGILHVPWGMLIGVLVWLLVTVFTRKDFGAAAGVLTFMVVAYKLGPKPEQPPEPTQRFRFR